jgi:hypothetical protein
MGIIFKYMVLDVESTQGSPCSQHIILATWDRANALKSLVNNNGRHVQKQWQEKKGS